MEQISRITADPRQRQTVILDDGTSFLLELYFRSSQQGWFISNLTYGDFVLHNLRICVSPNMLYQFQNQLPFGIACYSIGSREPGLIQDFASEAAQLFLLNQAEVAAYTEFIRGG